MDNLEYLNQISQSNRPTKTSSISGLSWRLIMKFLLAFVVIISVLVGVIILTTNGTTKTSTLTKQVYARSIYLNEALSQYNSKLKSSQLRAIGISLAGTLTNASSQIATYVASTSSDKNALALSTSAATEEADNINSLYLALDHARLNGLLDRTYAAQIQYQVSILIAMVSQLEARTEDAALLSILQTFDSSLTTIEQSFESYSNLGD